MIDRVDKLQDVFDNGLTEVWFVSTPTGKLYKYVGSINNILQEFIVEIDENNEEDINIYGSDTILEIFM